MCNWSAADSTESTVAITGSSNKVAIAAGAASAINNITVGANVASGFNVINLKQSGTDTPMLHLTWTVTAMPLISYKTKVLAIALTALLLAPHSMSANIGEVTKQDGQDASIARDADTIIVGPGTGVK